MDSALGFPGGICRCVSVRGRPSTSGTGAVPATGGSRGGRPAGFDKAICKRRNEVERTINALKNFRAVATRFGKRAYVFQGTVTLAPIRLWLRP